MDLDDEIREFWFDYQASGWPVCLTCDMPAICDAFEDDDESTPSCWNCLLLYPPTSWRWIEDT